MPPRRSSVRDCFGGCALLIGFCLTGAPVSAQTKPPTLDADWIGTSKRVLAPDCSPARAVRIIPGDLERFNARFDVFSVPLPWAPELCSPGETLGPQTGWLSLASTAFREARKAGSERRSRLGRDAAEMSGSAAAKSTVKVRQSGSGRDSALGAQINRPAFLTANTLAGAKANDPYGPYAYKDRATSFGAFEASRYSGETGSTDFTPQTTVKLRQSGKGQDSGLLSKLDGPAFLTSTTVAPDSSVRFQSGDMKLGGQYLQYVYGGQKTSVAGFESSMGFIGDELNRDAVEFRIARKIGDATVSFMTMQNNHFESDQTGIGSKNAQSFNQIGVDWSVQSWTLGAALRNTNLYSGGTQEEIRAYLTIPLGPVYVTPLLEMPFNDPVSGGVIGTLSLSGKAGGKMDYWGDVVFGNGTNLGLSSFDFGFNVYALGRWDLSVAANYSPGAWYGDYYVASNSGVSFSLTTEAEGLRFGPVIGWDSSAGAYMLAQASLPLGSVGRPSRWYLPGQTPKYDADLVRIVGYDLSCLIDKICR